MKKIIISLTSFLLLAIVYYVVAGHYKYELYDAAIGFEADLSELTVNTTDISIGEISYYENHQAGKKPSVLLVHGFGAYKENWLRFSRAFKDDYHVVVLDLPGHGYSVKNLDLTYTIKNQVAWLNEFVQKVGMDKFHLAGNSMGGAITAIYASTYPNKVITATLIDPAGVHDHEPVMKAYLDKGINPLVVKDASDFGHLMDFALEKQPFIPWPITEVSGLRAIALQDVHEKLWLDINAEPKERFKDSLKKITAPTLIQWGEQDRVINYKNMDAFKQLIAVSEAHLWKGVGHAPMVEIPAESANLMIEYIEKHAK